MVYFTKQKHAKPAINETKCECFTYPVNAHWVYSIFKWFGVYLKCYFHIQCKVVENTHHASSYQTHFCKPKSCQLKRARKMYTVATMSTNIVIFFIFEVFSFLEITINNRQKKLLYQFFCYRIYYCLLKCAQIMI